MPVFEYVGIDSKGKRAAGTVDAGNERDARQKLRRLGVFPTTLAVEGEGARKGSGLNMQFDVGKYLQRVKTQELAVMTRQLSTLVGSSIPLVDALTALVDQIENPKLRSILTRVRDRVTEGTRLSEAMAQHPRVFGDLYCNMINAGENSGALEVVLVRLSEFMEGQAKLKSKVISAMIYPAIMSVVGIGLMVMLLVYVVPKVTKIFTDVNATLPLPTRILMGVSNALTDYWYLFFIFIPIIVYSARRYVRSPKGRQWWDRKLLTLPIVGKINRLVVVSRFSRSPWGCSPCTRNQVFSAMLVAWSPMRSMFLAMNSRCVQAVIWRGSSAM